MNTVLLCSIASRARNGGLGAVLLGQEGVQASARTGFAVEEDTGCAPARGLAG